MQRHAGGTSFVGRAPELALSDEALSAWNLASRTPHRSRALPASLRRGPGRARRARGWPRASRADGGRRGARAGSAVPGDVNAYDDAIEPRRLERLDADVRHDLPQILPSFAFAGAARAPGCTSAITRAWSRSRSDRPRRPISRNPSAARSTRSTSTASRRSTSSAGPHVRRFGRADLRRDLHQLWPRGPRLRQRRLPVPGANFTATLELRNAAEHDLLLTSRSRLAFAGHYLSSVDSERDALTVLKLLLFQEQIHVTSFAASSRPNRPKAT